MRELWFYSWMSRFGMLNYRAKIMVMAFIGTHIPLISLASYFALQSSPDWATFLTTIGITLVATLIGTGLTLYVLNELLRPVIATSRTLRAYRESRQTGDLPTTFTDEVGTLMADASLTIRHLENIRDALEFVDEATGLPNRKRFLQKIEGAIARGKAFSLVVIRFQNFDRLAETLDLNQAEEAARLIAARLSRRLPESAGLARVAPSEFAFFDRRPEAVRTTADLAALAAAASADIALSSLTTKPELFGGVARYPADTGDASELLDHAISAAAMGTLATPVMFHSKQARANAVDQLKMEQELRRAVDHDEFTLYYQPVVDLGAGRARGAEALIRWRHPEHGLVQPGKFLPVAEASGLIDPIGLWVMRRACSQIEEWKRAGRDDLTVAINLSARQFLDPDLKSHITEAMSDSGIDPRQLEIELTETAAMADHDHTKRVFTMLRDLGVTIAIDDFGTGYASMSWLRKLPFDKLKIDREFVTDVSRNREAQAICGAMVALSAGLGLKVLAEGAETEEEVRYLSRLGCDLFQGFYFSKPLPANEFMPAIDALDMRAVLNRMRGGEGEEFSSESLRAQGV